jgi:hypothetical protein
MSCSPFVVSLSNHKRTFYTVSEGGGVKRKFPPYDSLSFKGKAREGMGQMKGRYVKLALMTFGERVNIL